jgi:hypothetical protein
MPWNRSDPDPLEARRRQLAQQERLLAAQRKRLTEQLQQTQSDESIKPLEPPVWRMEDEPPRRRLSETSTRRNRHLARQRQRDMVLFFIFIGVFLVVVVIVLFAYLRNTAPIHTA